MGEGLNTRDLIKQGIALQLIGAIVLIGIIMSYHIQLTETQGDFKEFKNLCNDSLNLIFDYKTNISEIINQQTKQIYSLEIDRTRLINELSLEYKNHNKLKQNYNQIKKEKGLINPTYAELERFVKKDRTNFKIYKDGYVCSEYTYEFIRNFEMEGFSSGSVDLNLICLDEDDEEHGHAIVIINTTDRGLIYLEPQDDYLFTEIHVGDNYCKLLDWECGWILTKISSKYGVEV